MSFRNLDLALFEFRRIYLPKKGEEMPREPLFCAGLISGSREEASWCHGTQPVDFFDAKGIVESILELARVENARWSAEAPEPFHHPARLPVSALVLFHWEVSVRFILLYFTITA